MEITISEMVQRINAAIADGNKLAANFKEKAIYFHDVLSQIIQQQITSGTPAEHKIVTPGGVPISGNVQGRG